MKHRFTFVYIFTLQLLLMIFRGRIDRALFAKNYLAHLFLTAATFPIIKIPPVLPYLINIRIIYRTLARNGRSGAAFSSIGTRYLFVNDCSPLSVETNVRRRKITSTENKLNKLNI